MPESLHDLLARIAAAPRASHDDPPLEVRLPHRPPPKESAAPAADPPAGEEAIPFPSPVAPVTEGDQPPDSLPARPTEPPPQPAAAARWPSAPSALPTAGAAVFDRRSEPPAAAPVDPPAGAYQGADPVPENPIQGNLARVLDAGARAQQEQLQTLIDALEESQRRNAELFAQIIRAAQERTANWRAVY